MNNLESKINSSFFNIDKLTQESLRSSNTEKKRELERKIKEEQVKLNGYLRELDRGSLRVHSQPITKPVKIINISAQEEIVQEIFKAMEDANPTQKGVLEVLLQQMLGEMQPTKEKMAPVVNTNDAEEVNKSTILESVALPNDVLLECIAPHLSVRDYASMAKVCSQWGSIFTPKCDEILYDRFVFDEKKWLQIRGVKSVSTYKVEPELKKEYIKRLKSPCDFFNEKDPIQPHRFEKRTNNLICDTRRLILIPEMINGEHVNINKIGRISGFVKGSWTAFRFIEDESDEYRERVAGKTKFLEVTLDVIPGSRNATYEEKEGILLKPKDYSVPSPLEALISMLVLNLGREDEFFFSAGEHYTFTTTSEFPSTNKLASYRTRVGAVSEWGIHVDNYSYDDEFGDELVGVMAVKEVLLGRKNS